MKERMYMEKKRLQILRERMEKIFPGGKAGTLLVYGGLFVLLLGLYAWQAWGKDPAKTQTKVAETSGQGMTAPALEARLEQTLSRIRGAGQVRVLITYETGGEKVTATVSTTDESLTQTQSGEAPLSRQLRETVQPATVTGEEGQEASCMKRSRRFEGCWWWRRGRGIRLCGWICSGQCRRSPAHL